MSTDVIGFYFFKKMSKEDNLGDTNTIYITLHETDSEKCKMGQKEGGFHRIKNQAREKETIWEWLESHSQLCLR